MVSPRSNRTNRHPYRVIPVPTNEINFGFLSFVMTVILTKKENPCFQGFLSCSSYKPNGMPFAVSPLYITVVDPIPGSWLAIGMEMFVNLPA
jgi:hypothetical protein